MPKRHAKFGYLIYCLAKLFVLDEENHKFFQGEQSLGP
jgi:hypothetical protein